MKAILTIFGVFGIILTVIYFNNIYTGNTTPVVKNQQINEEKTWSDYSLKDHDKGYVEYTPERLKNAKEEFIVLFFHAAWCPTCNAFEKKVRIEEIPENIVILKVNFDTEGELRKKYNIQFQTSFVIVDNQGNLKKKWLGARSIKDIIEKTQDL